MRLEIPTDGLKLIVKTGEIEGKPIWKDVGKLKITSKGQPKIYLDASFNPAACKECISDPTIAISLKEHSELDRQEGERRPPKPPGKHVPPEAYPFPEDTPF